MSLCWLNRYGGILIIATVIIFGGCRSCYTPDATTQKVSPQQLVGTWSEKLVDRTSQITLLPDMTFSQTVRMNNGTVLTSSGTWRIDSSTNEVKIDGLLMAMSFSTGPESCSWRIIDQKVDSTHPFTILGSLDGDPDCWKPLSFSPLASTP